MVIDMRGRFCIDDTGARVLHSEKPRLARLISVDLATKNVTSAAENIVFPNGIAIGSTGTNLFVSESFEYRFEKVSVSADGELSNRTTV